MSHYCRAALITCEDFRLHQRADGRNYIAEFIKTLGVDCDLITRGGAAQDIVRPKKENFDKSILRDAEVSAKLHNAEDIYIVHHDDCGAYGPMGLTPGEEEQAQHIKDMKEAKRIILENFPEKNIILCYAYLEKGSEDVFTVKQI